MLFKMRTEKDISYSAKLIPENTLDIYYPEASAVKSVLVFFHGGGLTDGDKDYDYVARYLTATGIAVVSANYRQYPKAKFPDFLEDCAEAVAWVKQSLKKYIEFENIFIGGSSAGAYIAMMLYFDKSYLAAHGIDAKAIAGYVFDGGQPTTHFSVLAERGLDSRLVRIDEAAPLYFIDKEVSQNERSPEFLIFVAEHDMQNRLEQTKLLIQTMLQFGYNEDRIHYNFMEGYQHCGYGEETAFMKAISDFINNI